MCCNVAGPRALYDGKQRDRHLLVLGPLQWWLRVFQLSTAGGSASAEKELSASSSSS